MQFEHEFAQDHSRISHLEWTDEAKEVAGHVGTFHL